MKKAFTTEIKNTLHSEEIAIEFLKKENIPSENVKRIYSELEPCELSGHTCKMKLKENYPTAEISYSYDYPGGIDNTIRKKSLEIRDLDLDKLLK